MSQIERTVALRYPQIRKETEFQRRPNSAIVQVADCPAASAEFADGVIGFRQSGDDHVNFFDQTIEFPKVLRESQSDAEIESRLRLVGRCVRNICPHWMGSCVLGHTVGAMVKTETNTDSPCSIVDRCRWRIENGPEVCTPCRGILNVLVEEV